MAIKPFPARVYALLGKFFHKEIVEWFDLFKKAYNALTAGLAASRIVATDASGNLEDVDDLTAWIASTDGHLTVADDGDGSVTIDLEDTWVDINIGGVSLGKGATAPDLVQVNGGAIYLPGFDGNATTEQLFGSIELDHFYKEGTIITPHVHWMPSTGNAGDVKWQLTYAFAVDGAVITAETTVSGITAAGGVAWDTKQTELGTIAGTGRKIEDQLLFRFFRIPTGDDTYGDDAVMATIGFHLEKDTIGSRTLSAK
ncbi:hypothetical protein LCGC14_1439960 [marine sediment metagenome]|uniref:Uncharacterized protein n=1 Tax=marine sediment metagenome TaxID=412755 RepID=A0A0F9JKY4_9ZZZZ|nr:hypothetical protein [Desulfobacterales bacterium]